MGNINPAIAIVVALAALCFQRALSFKSRNDEVRKASRFGELLWDTIGTDLLALAAVLWTASEPNLVFSQRILLGIVGGIAGCLTLIMVGELIRPRESSAQTQSVNPPVATNYPDPCPPGTGICLNNTKDARVEGNKCYGMKNCIVDNQGSNNTYKDNQSR